MTDRNLDTKFVNDVKKTITALLASRNNPITIQQLCSDYNEATGRNLPYSKLGYTTVEALIHDWNDVLKPVWDGSQSLITYRTHFNNPQTQNVIGLIKGQKQNKSSETLTGSTNKIMQLKECFIERSLQDRILNYISIHTNENRKIVSELPIYKRFVNSSLSMEIITYPELKHIIKQSFSALNVELSSKNLYFLSLISVEYLTPLDADYYHSVEKRYQQYSPGIMNFFIVRFDDDLIKKLYNLYSSSSEINLYCINELYRIQYSHNIPLKLFGFRSTIDMCDYYSFKFYLFNGNNMRPFKINKKNGLNYHQYEYKSSFYANLTCIHNVNSFWLQISPNNLLFIEHTLKKYWLSVFHSNSTITLNNISQYSPLIANINGKLFRTLCADPEPLLLFFIDYGWFKCVTHDSIMVPNSEVIDVVFSIPAQAVLCSLSMVHHVNNYLTSYLSFLLKNQKIYATIVSKENFQYIVSLQVEGSCGLIDIYELLAYFQTLTNNSFCNPNLSL